MCMAVNRLSDRRHVRLAACRVASHQHTNLMGAENLATVFAPNLLRSPESEVQCGWSALKHERDLIELLIRHCNLLD